MNVAVGVVEHSPAADGRDESSVRSHSSSSPAAEASVWNTKEMQCKALRTWPPRAMLAKLKHDRQRIRENNHDAYAAFDFFVTAYHILDWLHPDPSGACVRRALRDSEPLLQLADHIANGAEHFVLTNKRHQSVTSLEDKSGAFSAEAFSSAFSANAFAFDGLHVKLTSGDLAAVPHVADASVRYWESKLSSA